LDWNSKVPTAPDIPLTPADGSPEALAKDTDEVKAVPKPTNSTKIRGIATPKTWQLFLGKLHANPRDERWQQNPPLGYQMMPFSR
jgi:hypothetical protein